VVVGRRVLVVDDRAQLREVAGAQQVGDVAHRRLGQQGSASGATSRKLRPPASNDVTKSPVNLR